MPTLQVRDLPQDLYDKLADEAATEFRSLAQQTTAILDQHFRDRAERMQVRVVRRDEGSPQAVVERLERRRRIFADLDAINEGVTWPDDETCRRLLEESRGERR